MRFKAVVLVLLSLGATLPATSALAQPSARERGEQDTERSETLQSATKRMLERATAGDITGAKAELDRILALPDFVDQQPSIRYAILLYASYFETELGNSQQAFERAIAAGAEAPELRDARYWLMLTLAARKVDANAEYFDALTFLVRDYPESSASWNNELFREAIRRRSALDDGDERLARLFEALWDSGYEPELSPAITADPYWLELAAFYMTDGNETEAHRVVASLQEPDSQISLSIDSRFGQLAPNDPVQAFVTAESELIENLRDQVEDDPGSFFVLLTLVEHLSRSGQASEALTQVDQAIARVETAASSDEVFKDSGRYLPALYNYRARLLFLAGDTEGAIKAQERSVDIATETNADVVSQLINLGDMHNQLGQPEDALAAVRGLRPAELSAYGVMSTQAVRACAYYQLGDNDRLAEALTYLIEHVQDGYIVFQDAMLCADKQADLAHVLIGRLADPATRLESLQDIQSFSDAPFRTPLQDNKRQRLAQLKSRFDVAAVVAQFGLILSWPTLPPSI